MNMILFAGFTMLFICLFAENIYFVYLKFVHCTIKVRSSNTSPVHYFY